jgi:ribosomal protein L37AE/L43A
MSVRCKVCNALKIASNKINSDDVWECKICGNLLDEQGHVITS